MLLADIASGETDWADIFFLVAMILAAVVSFLYFQARSLEMALLSLAIGFLAAGFLVL